MIDVDDSLLFSPLDAAGSLPSGPPFRLPLSLHLSFLPRFFPHVLPLFLFVLRCSFPLSYHYIHHMSVPSIFTFPTKQFHRVHFVLLFPEDAGAKILSSGEFLARFKPNAKLLVISTCYTFHLRNSSSLEQHHI